MVRVANEYDVWCDKCEKQILFDSPDDLTKEFDEEKGRMRYCCICPSCGEEIWFDSGLEPEFAEQVKERGKTVHATVRQRSNEEVKAIIEKTLSTGKDKCFEECDW